MMFHYIYLFVVTFELVESHARLSPEICSNISEIIVRYRDYYNVYLGLNLTNLTNVEPDKSGQFYVSITNAVRKCCPNLTAEFIFENTTESDTDELVMNNLVDTTTRPRPFVFYFPEFAVRDSKHVYDYELSFVKLTRSQGQAVVMDISGGSKTDNNNTVMKIIRSSGLLLLYMLLLSWLFGILGWATDHWKNAKDFPSPFVVGMFEGFWWSIITMTTVGYGDKTAKSVPARIVAVIWVMLSAVLLSIFTAHVTTMLDRSLIEKDYSSTLGLKIGVLFSKDFDESQLNLGAQVINYRSINNMFAGVKKKDVNRLLFPDYKFLLLLYEQEKYKHYLEDYTLVKMFESPFQIGMVLALDPETQNKADKMFLRCLRSAITIEEKKMSWSPTSYHLLKPKETRPVLSNEIISRPIYYTLAVIAFLTSVGIAWDLLQYFKRRKKKESKKADTSPVERVMPVLHYNNYRITTLC